MIFTSLNLTSEFPNLPALQKDRESEVLYDLCYECGFTLKRVRGMTRTHSQMHCTDKHS